MNKKEQLMIDAIERIKREHRNDNLDQDREDQSIIAAILMLEPSKWDSDFTHHANVMSKVKLYNKTHFVNRAWLRAQGSINDYDLKFLANVHRAFTEAPSYKIGLNEALLYIAKYSESKPVKNLVVKIMAGLWKT